MTTFLTLLHHEQRRLRRDPAFLWAVLLFMSLFLIACFQGQARVRQHQETLSQRQQEEAQRLAELKEKLASGVPATNSHRDPKRPANFGGRLGKHWASLPPFPHAGLLAVGQSDLFPSSVAVTTRGKETLTGTLETENPMHLLVGHFDPAFVLVYLYPLFLLAFSYNLLVEEKESGTLALVQCQSVSLRALLLGKLTARVALLVAPVSVLTVVAPCVIGRGPWVAGELSLLLGAGLSSFFYGLFWLLVCALSNLRTHQSSQGSLAGLLSAWIALTVILPAAISEGAQVLYPAPPRSLLIEKARTASLEATEQGSAILARYYADHPELAAIERAKAPDPKDSSARRTLVDQQVEDQLQPLRHAFEEQVARQQTIVGRTRTLLPPVALLLSLSEASGTGQSRLRGFQQQVSAFHETWKAWFYPKIMRRDAMRPEDISQLPRFHYQAEDPTHYPRSIAGSTLSLSVVCLLVGLTIYFYKPKS
jgi:ABC-2 type transport system permease protein